MKIDEIRNYCIFTFGGLFNFQNTYFFQQFFAAFRLSFENQMEVLTEIFRKNPQSTSIDLEFQ